MELNTIKCGDAFKELPNFPDNSVDCVLTDPPYNISRETNFHTMANHMGTSMDFGEWDKNFDITGWIKLLPRILKDGANVIIFNSWENLGEIAKVMRENEIEPKRSLVIRKSNPAPFNRDRLFVNDLEFVIWGVYKNKDWTFNRQDDLQKCFFDTQVQNKEWHPTMKDINVIADILKILTNENDVVLDPFIGTGTTAVVCKSLKRNFIGIEIDPKYAKIAQERINSISNTLF